MHSPQVLQAWREAWRCDCDGVSHTGVGCRSPALAQSVKAVASHIEAVAGMAPPTCPWRCMYDPLVREVIRVANLADKGLGAPYLGNDPDARLMDALSIYFHAKGSTSAHYHEEERKKREHERRVSEIRGRR